MSRKSLVAFLLAGTLPLSPLAKAADPRPEPRQEPAEVPTFNVGTAAVTLDIVVRDKKGNIVRDLKPSEFEVFEDGARQKVDSFQVVGGATPEPPEPAPSRPATTTAVAAAPTAPPAEATDKSPQVIAFVFDRLGANARNMAYKAALTYLDKGHVEGDLVGIFSIDLALRTLQPFTREVTMIRAGLERAASQGNTEFASGRENVREMVDQITNAERTLSTATGSAPSGPGADPSAIGQAAGAAALNQAVNTIQVGMLRQFEALERDQQGLATVNALLAVVSGLKSLPGRKTVIFFSEGMVIPANVQAQFRSVIHSANRANVSVYTMDAGGLRAQGMNEETRKEMLQAMDRRLAQLATGRNDATAGPMTGALERNEALLMLNPESGLGILANETGGFMIRDTNDAGAAFRRIEEDMRFYYLLAYTPTNENYDGRFRTVAVKVTRSGVQVQTRQGYYAVRAVESAPLRTFEAPILALLEGNKRPTDFPLRAVGLTFPTSKRPGLVPVLVQVPGNTVSFVPDKDDKSGKKMHRADFSVVVRVLDKSKREVDRVSQHYALSAAEANLASARAGDILFYREANLPPGHYKLEAVGYDAFAKKASVREATLDVPKVLEDHVRLSSLVLIGKAEKAPASEERSDNPLFYGQTILYPNMGEPVRKAANPALGFFFTVYGGKDPATPRKATIEIFQGDTAAGKVIANLPPPDADGRIQYAGALPIQNFTAGPYKLKVTASDGTGFDTQQAAFTVTE